MSELDEQQEREFERLETIRAIRGFRPAERKRYERLRLLKEERVE